MHGAHCPKARASAIARPVCSPLPPAGSKAFGAQSAKFKYARFKNATFGPAPRRLSVVVQATMAGKASRDPLQLTAERSALVNREIVLFLFQLEMDSQLQRALTYENFDGAQDIRRRRQQVDEALRELQENKGYGCGALGASRSAKFEYAPMTLSLRSRMSIAIREERYSEAARLRDRISALEIAAAEAELPCPISEPRFSLGEMVVHNAKGYRGVVCGWDLACCESSEWRAAAGLASLESGSEQVYYHVLVDASDWPQDLDDPPVAYVAEELLDAASLADFTSAEPLVDSSFQHPYAYLMFLGSDGHGNMIPCRQLRERYCVDRADTYAPWQDEDEWENDEEGVDDVDVNNNGNTTSTPGLRAGGDGSDGGGIGIEESSGDLWGKSKIPGIDMSSLN